MTPKEAIDKITWTPLMRSPHENGELKEALYMACNALENADKYRWHDLRKDPNDLPTRTANYIIWYESKNGLNSGGKVITYSKNDKRSGWLVGKNRSDECIVAWREIEPFEVRNGEVLIYRNLRGCKNNVCVE